MGLQIQMAGTGSAFAKKYYNNNALIFTDNYTLMVDFGITAPSALYALDKPFDQIDGFLITHLHADHVGGLEELAFQMKYVYQKKPTLFVPSALIEPLWENSLKAGLESKTEGFVNLQSYFHVVPLEEKAIKRIDAGLSLEIIRTPHIPNKASYSLVVNDQLFYSADVVFDRALLDEVHRVRKCKYVLHDCQLHPPGVVHAALEQLLTLPEEMQENTYLMHYGDDMPDFAGKTGKMTILEQHKLYSFV